MRKVRIVEPTSPMGTAKKKIAAYCRVSTESTTQANSYEMQKQYFTHHFANSTTEELTEVYADIGSGTGTLNFSGCWTTAAGEKLTALSPSR